jgi:hypothetical protein
MYIIGARRGSGTLSTRRYFERYHEEDSGTGV